MSSQVLSISKDRDSICSLDPCSRIWPHFWTHFFQYQLKFLMFQADAPYFSYSCVPRRTDLLCTHPAAANRHTPATQKGSTAASCTYWAFCHLRAWRDRNRVIAYPITSLKKHYSLCSKQLQLTRLPRDFCKAATLLLPVRYTSG